MPTLDEIITHSFYSAAFASGCAALLAAIVGAIWRRSFMWFAGLIVFVVVVAIPLQVFTKQLVRPSAGITTSLDSWDRFLWGNVMPCGLIFILAIYITFLASREYRYAKMEAIALAERERQEAERG